LDKIKSYARLKGSLPIAECVMQDAQRLVCVLNYGAVAEAYDLATGGADAANVARALEPLDEPKSLRGNHVVFIALATFVKDSGDDKSPLHDGAACQYVANIITKLNNANLTSTRFHNDKHYGVDNNTKVCAACAVPLVSRRC
jgi:hypothetical protein